MSPCIALKYEHAVSIIEYVTTGVIRASSIMTLWDVFAESVIYFVTTLLVSKRHLHLYWWISFVKITVCIFCKVNELGRSIKTVCTLFALCCVLFWLCNERFDHILQAYFTDTYHHHIANEVT